MKSKRTCTSRVPSSSRLIASVAQRWGSTFIASAQARLTREGSSCGNGCVNMRLQHNEVGLKASNTRGCRGGVARMMLSTGQSKEAANRLSDRPLT